MFTVGWSKTRALREITSVLREQVQQLTTELAELRAQALTRDDPDAIAALAARVDEARLRSQRKLDRLLAGIHDAGEAALLLGAAFENFAANLRAPGKRGWAGGIARARLAWRYSDGAFMPNDEAKQLREEFELEEYEHHAAGGRARASRARRAADGRFLPVEGPSRNEG